ncbi:hypothetical protein F4810DRAFT_105807 [Camillea tinctor]|nr:hypothetical protein F4810DRAFT_105807 [Camillea tinctor]
MYQPHTPQQEAPIEMWDPHSYHQLPSQPGELVGSYEAHGELELGEDIMLVRKGALDSKDRMEFSGFNCKLNYI